MKPFLPLAYPAAFGSNNLLWSAFFCCFMLMSGADLHVLQAKFRDLLYVLTEKLMELMKYSKLMSG
jgi:hypothetical protein